MSETTLTLADTAEGLDFVRKMLARLAEKGLLSERQRQALAARLDERRASCAEALREGRPLPDDIDLPTVDAELGDPAAARRIWFNDFAALEIRRLADAGLMPLYLADDLAANLREQTAAIRHRAATRRPGPTDQAAAAPPAPRRKEAAPAAPRRGLLEILLDPRSIQWLLGSGAALMVLGLVILLWVNQLLTPPVVAVSLGAANAAVLAGGWAVLRKTRYQTAGRALTLLACLVMPLNLWYYHVNGLVTIGGHLWVGAVVISALYAASALVLRDEMFVYVFVAGVTLTGLLILADLPPSPQRFWEIALPSTMLVVLGLLAIHAERAFPEQEGPFGRRRFGLAFFWSGHALLAAGLLLLLGAQLAGHWLYEPVFRPLYQQLQAQPSPVVTDPGLQLLALALVLAGTYAYVYSDLVVRRVGVYVHVAAFTLLWAEILIVELLHLELGVDALIAIFAGTALLVHLAQFALGQESRLTRAFPVLGLLLGLLPVVLGVFVYAQALSGTLRGVWENRPPTWSYVGAMLLTAVACRVGAHLYRNSAPKLAALYFFATGAATLVAAVALLAALGLRTWEQHAPVMMLIPIAYLLAARLYRGRPGERPLVWVAHAATGVLLASSLASALRGFTVVEGQPLNLALALFFAEAALFYGLAAAFRREPASVHLAALMGCGVVWQLLTYAGVAAEYYTLTFAAVGLGLLLAYRFAVLERFAAVRLAEAAFQAGNALLSLAFVAAAFLGLSRLAAHDVQWGFVGLCVVLGAMALASAVLVRQENWRRWYVVAAVGQGLLAFLAVQVLSHLTPWQKLEIFCVAVGLLLLAVGHVGWYREQERHSDLVSLSLLFGSLLAGVPLAVAAIVDRYRGNFEGFYVLNELGFLAVSLLLLVSGVLFRLRATTLTGAALTVLYFVTLLVYLPWGRMNVVAVALTAGGGVIFGLGLLLSVYRERLLALPDRVKRREGIFRVLAWR
jgi:hypothetical protein